MESLELGSGESPYIHSPPLPQCPPNTAELEMEDSFSDGADAGVPLCTFDSPSLSLEAPFDSQGFALLVESETQSLSLPSEPPELDLRDWILRHRIELPCNEEKIHFRGPPPIQTEKNAKGISIFSRKNWDAVLSSIDEDIGRENEEQEHLDSKSKKQRTHACDQDTQFQVGLQKNSHTQPLSETDNLDDLEITPNSPIASPMHPQPEVLANAIGCQLKDVEAISEIPILSTTCSKDGIKEEHADNKKENPSLVALQSETQNAVDSDSETRDAVAPDSETEGESEGSVVESTKQSPSSRCQWSSDILLAEKENLFQEESAPLPSSRTRSFSTDGLRKPLSDTRNFQSQHCSDKWRCPRVAKKHFRPPSKQLSLDQWLGPAK